MPSEVSKLVNVVHMSIVSVQMYLYSESLLENFSQHVEVETL